MKSKLEKEFKQMVDLDITESVCSQDNFVVWEKTLQEHDKHLRKVLLKIRERFKAKLNCQIREQSIVLSHILPEGIN